MTLQEYITRDTYENAPAILLLINYAAYRVKPAFLLNLESQLIAAFEKVIAKSGKVPHVGKFITSIFELLLLLKPVTEW